MNWLQSRVRTLEIGEEKNNKKNILNQSNVGYVATSIGLNHLHAYALIHSIL